MNESESMEDEQPSSLDSFRILVSITKVSSHMLID